MALITLSEKETFEHYHTVPSFTKLLKGTAVLKKGNKVVTMRIGRRVTINANQLHSIVNTGSSTVQVECAHGGA